MKTRLATTALMVGMTFFVANMGFAGRGSGNRVATVSFGKHFDRGEVISIVDPALTPLGFTRLPDSARDQTLASVPGVTYETGGGITKGGVMAFIFPDRSLNCVTISVTDFYQLPEQRILPAINAIATALAQHYGSAMKNYSDGQCLHVISPHA